MGRTSGPGNDAMPRKTLLASALAAAAFAGPGRAGAETLHLENINGMQEVVGGTPAQPRAGAALRLENAIGMQEVVYDQGAPARPTAPHAAPRVVNEGGGEHGIAYDR
jgi:hypothetical protein